jgi:hypothetical protein
MICPSCRADLLARPHDGACPGRVAPLVRRLALTPADARAEDALLVATRRALRAWERGGGRP